MPETPDVLEQGGSGRRRRFPVLLAVVLLAIAAGATYVVVRHPDPTRLAGGWRHPAGGRTGDGRDDGRGDGRGEGGRNADGPRGIADGPGWSAATAPGRCGPTVLPRWHAASRPHRTGLHVLTGGPVLARVDLDTGRRETLLDAARSGLPDAFLADVVTVGRTVYARVGDCSEGDGVVYVLRDGRPPRALPGRHVARLLAGRGGVWAVSYPHGRNGPVVLRDTGGRTFRLPAGTDPEGVTGAGAVVTREQETPLSPRLALLDPATGRIRRALGIGYTLSVTGQDLMWYGTVGCNDIGPEDDAPCDVRRTGLRGGRPRTYPLPPDRMIRRDTARLSPDGRRLAFCVNRYVAERPGDAARIVTEVGVLDLRTGRFTTVPDVSLPVATFGDAEIGLTFAARGRLVISVGEGTRGHLLVYEPGARSLAAVPGRVPGPLDGYAPVAVAP